jgi:plasmid stabilization system protein ParE
VAREIIWTAGAESDLLQLYEQVGDHEVAIQTLRQPLDRALNLLAENPGLGPKVRGTKSVRRLLTGAKMQFGVFYVDEARGILLHALLDMRQDPKLIRRRLGDL